MTPEKWQKVEEIFQEAVERPVNQRLAYLTQVCSGDDELRTEVQSLLDHEVQESFFRGVVGSEAHLFDLEASEPVEGLRIGVYRLNRLIGHGGMGAVYLAERDDDHYRKQVALKVVKRGMDTDFVLSRFRYERQILATLEHQHIARLLDGGATPDGLPYFVMEHIEGLPITEYCEKHRLSVPERLKLFRAVCSAVQYAHQKLIVHRDLKPSNILVTKEGEVKLLDFGIAKLMDAEQYPQYQGAPPQTSTEMRLMTPDYASPEQVRGRPVTASSDIYSLGVLLYELLTGERPHRLKNYNQLEIEEAICQAEITRPSTAATTAKLRRQLTGDLDNIVLTAMRKEPERRYNSVEQFSEDIRRHLEGHPVIARPDTLGYRVGKFVRRRRLAIAAVSLVMLSLVAGLLMARYQAGRAERRFQQVRKLANTFLFDFHEKIRPLPGSTEAREMVVRTGLEYLDSLAQEADGDPVLQSELTLAYLKLGDVQGETAAGHLGQIEAAQASYGKALGLAQKLVARDGGDLKALRALTSTYYKIGDLEAEHGDPMKGIATLRQSLALAEMVDARSSDEKEDRLLLYGIYERLGDAQLKAKDAAGAVESYREVLKLAERMAADMTPERAQFSMALSHARLGDALMSRGDLAKTMESYRKAVQLHENLAQNFPHNAVYRRELMMDYNWLGDCAGGLLFINLGDRRAAEEYYRKGLAISEELSAADPKNAHARLDLAVSYGKMGEVLSDTDPAQARDYFRRGLATTNDLLKLAPDEFWYLRRKGMQLRGMAEPTAKLGDLPGAIRELREALGIFRSLADRNPTNARIQSDLILTHRSLGRMLLEAGDRQASSEHYREAVTLAEAASVSAKSDLHSLWRLADTYAALGSFHASLANDLQIAPAERAAQYRAARSWRQKAFDVWNTWSQHGVSSVFDATRREEAARLLTQTDQELSSLSSK